jgi:hypothetical protein
VTYEIRDFSNEQIEVFVSKWFQHNPSLGTILLRQISIKEEIKRLAAVPLLLTFLCMDVETFQSTALPENMLETDLTRRVVHIPLDG